MYLRTTLLALGLALTGSAHAVELNEAQSRYQGAVTCIDRLFYDGGYDEGDAQRVALINEFLSHNKLPAYDEATYSQAQQKGTQIDTTAFMAGYELCNEVDYVTALGKRHGRELPEG